MAGSGLRHLRGVALAAALLCGAAAQAQLHAAGVAARVDGAEISAERLERGFEEYLRERQIHIGAMRSPQRVKTLKREALDLLIDQELLWQEARRRGLLADDAAVDEAAAALRRGFASDEAFAARLRTEGYDEASYRTHLHRLLSARRVLEQATAAVTVDDAAIHDFYRQNEAKFEQPEQRRVRHLVLPLGDGIDAAAQRARIAALRERLAGGADFAALAREHSQGSSAGQGGDIGFVQRDELAPLLSQAAFALREGEVSAAIELPDGLHLLRVEATVAARRVGEAEARERIRAHLLAQRAARAREAVMNKLRAQARIEVLAALPPVSGTAEESFSPARRARNAGAPR